MKSPHLHKEASDKLYINQTGERMKYVLKWTHLLMLLAVNKKNYIKYLGRRTVHLCPILWAGKSVIIVLLLLTFWLE